MQSSHLTFQVDGLSCGHCEIAVTDEVSQIFGVDSVEVDLETKLVRVRGTDVDAQQVIGAIDEAGYEGVAA